MLRFAGLCLRVGTFDYLLSLAPSSEGDRGRHQITLLASDILETFGARAKARPEGKIVEQVRAFFLSLAMLDHSIHPEEFLELLQGRQRMKILRSSFPLQCLHYRRLLVSLDVQVAWINGVERRTHALLRITGTALYFVSFGQPHSRRIGEDGMRVERRLLLQTPVLLEEVRALGASQSR